ncbi:hypothetical protein JTB14_007947 [Gonioctena quinquepunctata]|nr:hypothetical protein JTB14_007947 [Gonioctena quinquepunctata]
MCENPKKQEDISLLEQIIEDLAGKPIRDAESEICKLEEIIDSIKKAPNTIGVQTNSIETISTQTQAQETDIYTVDILDNVPHNENQLQLSDEENHTDDG